VIVTVPKAPLSTQLMLPFSVVFEMAPGNVLHGAVRLHGLASSPTPETQDLEFPPSDVALSLGMRKKIAAATAAHPAADIVSFLSTCTPLVD